MFQDVSPTDHLLCFSRAKLHFLTFSSVLNFIPLLTPACHTIISIQWLITDSTSDLITEVGILYPDSDMIPIMVNEIYCPWSVFQRSCISTSIELRINLYWISRVLWHRLLALLTYDEYQTFSNNGQCHILYFL